MELRWKISADECHRTRLIEGDGMHSVERRIPFKGQFPGHHLIEDDSHGEDITGLIDGQTACLLRTHVSGCAHHGSGLSMRIRLGLF